MAEQQDPLNSTPSPQPPPDLPEGSIHLKVKVPHGTIPSPLSTFSLGAVPVTSTIGSVRQQIQQSIPSNPTPERQRLLYGGRALHDDAETVQDALNTRRNAEQREYVVHLLIRGSQPSESRTASPANVNTTSRSASTAQQPQNAAQPNQNSMAHIQQQMQQQMQQHMEQAMRTHGQQAHAPQAFGMRGMPGMPMNPQMLQQMQNPALFQQMQQAQAQANQQPRPSGQDRQSDESANSMEANVGSPSNPQTQPPTSQPQQGGATQTGDQGQQDGNSEVIDEITTEIRGPNGERLGYQHHTYHHPHGENPARSGYVTMQNHTPAPQQQGQQGNQGMPAFHMGPPPQFTPVGGQGGMFGMQPMQMPHMGMPQIGGGMGMPNTPQGGQRPGGRSTALDQARSNITEMRRMINELREGRTDPGAEANRTAVIEQLEQRVRDVEGYIDPFALHRANAPNAANANTTARAASTPAGTPQNNAQLRMRLQQRPASFLPSPFQQPTQTQPSNPNDVTAYLLSDPNGPRALLYHPTHGLYTSDTQTEPQPITQRVNLTNQNAPNGGYGPNQNQEPDPVVRAAAQAFARRDQGIEDPLGPIQPLLGHFWLLFRVLIFAYFLLGSDMGWTKMLMLASIALAFWVLRVWVLDNAEVIAALRRWWEGVVGVPARAGNQQQQGQGQAGQQRDQNQAQPAQVDGQAQQQAPANEQRGVQGRMPTPEQVAQRLLNDQAAQQRGWFREQIRPLERAVALFLASLWPGIGEAHVRAQREAREAEERRQNEAEVERRRIEEQRENGEKNEGESAEAKDGQAGGAGDQAVTSEKTGEASGMSGGDGGV